MARLPLRCGLSLQKLALQACCRKRVCSCAGCLRARVASHARYSRSPGAACGSAAAAQPGQEAARPPAACLCPSLSTAVLCPGPTADAHSGSTAQLLQQAELIMPACQKQSFLVNSKAVPAGTHLLKACSAAADQPDGTRCLAAPLALHAAQHAKCSCADCFTAHIARHIPCRHLPGSACDSAAAAPQC